MRCKEILKEYFTNFSVKVVYDIIFSCKMCVLVMYLLYAGVMFFNYVPSEFQALGFERVMLSLFLGAVATVITMPAFFIGMVAIGILIRFAKDACSGGCCLMSWFKNQIEH